MSSVSEGLGHNLGLVSTYFSAIRAQLTQWPKEHVPWAPHLGGRRAPSCLAGQNDKCKSENNQLLKCL